MLANSIAKCIAFLIVLQISSALKPILIVLSFDGFKNDYISERLTPTLSLLAKNGVRGHMIPNFITKTYPNHQSIATGFYVENHGIVSNGFFDPKYNQTFDMEKSPDHFWTEWPVTPVWIANQMHGEVSGIMAWPGGHVRYHNQTVRYLQRLDLNMTWTVRVDKIVSWLTDQKEPANCIFSYWEEPDTYAHEYGPNHPLVLKQVTKVDTMVANLISKLKSKGLLHRSNFVFLSDHGFAEIRNTSVIFLDQFLDPGLYEIYGGSPVRSIMPKPGYEEVVYQKLKNASKTMSITVYRRNEIPQRFHYRNNRRVLDIFVVTDEGWDVFKNREEQLAEFPKGYPVWGNHGWDNLLPSMRPLFIAKGPAFKTGYIHKKTFINSDLFPLLLNTLKVTDNKFPSNSNFENVIGILRR